MIWYYIIWYDIILYYILTTYDVKLLSICNVNLKGKEKDLQEKEMKLMELQEVYETRLLQLKVNILNIL